MKSGRQAAVTGPQLPLTNVGEVAVMEIRLYSTIKTFSVNLNCAYDVCNFRSLTGTSPSIFLLIHQLDAVAINLLYPTGSVRCQMYSCSDVQSLLTEIFYGTVYQRQTTTVFRLFLPHPPLENV